MKLQQRGAILLWVVMTLTVIAAVAFTMTRQSGMAAQSVESGFDTAVARYLAEAALNHARWQNEKAGCSGHGSVVMTTLPGIGSYRATVTNKQGGKSIDIQATGTTPAGASFTSYKTVVVMHDTGNQQTVQLGQGKKDSDIWLSADFPTQTMSNATYLELTQGRSNALLQFDLASIPANSRISKAVLSATEYFPVTGAPGQVSAHRVQKNWDAVKATWLVSKNSQSWTNPGGDYDSANLAVVNSVGAGQYDWDITSLVDGWSNNTVPNYGVLLKPDGPLAVARFASLQNTTGVANPELLVDYAAPCP